MKKTAIFFILSLILANAFMFSCGGGGGGVDNTVNDIVDDTSFTISYNANGAEFGTIPSSQYGDKNSYQIVQNNTGNLAKNGYWFDGWNTKTDGSGTDYVPGTSYSGKNITLYAKWVAIFNYDVINPGAPSPSLIEGQRSPSLSSASITGLTEKGRTLSAINIPESIDGYTITSIGDNAFQDCNIISYVLIPDSVRSIGNYAFSGCSGLSGIVLRGTEPPTVGTDVFAGCWMLVVNVPKSAESTYKADPSWGAMTIFGSFRITYNANNATSGSVPSEQEGETGETITLQLNTGNLERSGYRFIGWNTQENGKGVFYVAGGSYTVMYSNLNLYAMWLPLYTINYNSNDATGGLVPTPQTGIDGEQVTLKGNTGNLVRTGYMFTGWNLSSTGTGTHHDVNTSYTIKGNITLYAEWSPNSCTISYNSNNATSGSVPTNQVALYNQSISLRANTGNLARNGYLFDGWNTEADGSGTSYAVGANYTIKGNATLYAKWVLSYTSTPGNRSGVAVGDIVLADGKTVTPINYTAATYAAYTTASGTPVGVIAYEGNATAGGTTSQGGGTGKWYMVQIDYDNTSMQWCLSDTNGYAKMTQLLCEQNCSYSGYYNTYSVAKKWNDYTDANYPAFAKAINYHAPGTINENKYYSGWFLPTWRELDRLIRGVDENGETLLHYERGNLILINNSITTIANAGKSGTNLLPTSDNNWSSSQGASLNGIGDAPKACYVGFGQYDIAATSHCCSKTSNLSVVVMRALDD